MTCLRKLCIAPMEMLRFNKKTRLPDFRTALFMCNSVGITEVIMLPVMPKNN